VSSAVPTVLAIPVDLQAASTARRGVAAALRAGHVDEAVQADAVLLVSELVSNVVRHETSHTINLEIALDVAGAVTVTVTGSQGAPSGVPVVAPVLPPPSSGSGRGLFIVDALALAWGTRRSDGRTSVWFTMPYSGSGDAPSDDMTAFVGLSVVPATSSAA
jgi:serine/threonine-protein kinase RsbW